MSEATIISEPTAAPSSAATSTAGHEVPRSATITTTPIPSSHPPAPPTTAPSTPSAPITKETMLAVSPSSTEQKPSSPELPSYELKLDPQNGSVTEITGLKLPAENRVLNKEALEKLAAFAKEKKLSPEQAQMVLERENAVLFDHEKAQERMLAEHRKSWLEESRNDPEIGGQRFAQNSDLARRMIEQYAPPELKKALNDTGLGNYLPLVKFVVNVAKAQGEDRFVAGSPAPVAARRRPEDVFYPGQSSET